MAASGEAGRRATGEAGAEAGAGAGAETGAETGEVLRDLLQVQRVQTGVAGDKEHAAYTHSVVAVHGVATNLLML